MALPLLALCAIGAGVGAVVSAGVYLAFHHDSKTFSWGALGAATAGGAVAGATAPIVGTELGIGWLATHVMTRSAIALGISAGLGSGVTKVIDNVRTKVHWAKGLLKTMGTSALLGAALSFVGGGLFANASRGQIDAIVAEGEKEVEKEAPSVIAAAAGALKTQLDGKVPANLTNAVDGAIDNLAGKATQQVNQVVDNLAPKVDDAVVAAQGALRTKLGMGPLNEGTTAATTNGATTAATTGAADATANGAANGVTNGTTTAATTGAADATANGATNVATTGAADATAGTSAASGVTNALAPATAKQVVFVGSLKHSLQVSDQDFAKLLGDAASKVGGPVAATADQLTREQAKYVIQQLLAKEAAQHSIHAAGRSGAALTLGKFALGEIDKAENGDASSAASTSGAPSGAGSGPPSGNGSAPSSGDNLVVPLRPGTTVTVTIKTPPAPSKTDGINKTLDRVQ